MITRHLKVNEIFNFIVYTTTSESIKTEYCRIDNNGNGKFITLPGSLNSVDGILFIKQISFDEAGEYLIKVTTPDTVEYERYKIHSFSDEDTEMKLDNLLLSVENVRSELNEEILFLKRQLKIINAQL